MADEPEDLAFAELTAAGVLDELAAAACRHRVMVTLTFAPYDDPADG
jgi:hypothetical protein